MRLISGPPGAGKSWRFRAEIAGFLARRQEDWRLLAPTATMAEHLRNTAARDGWVFRPSLISTLSRFLLPFHEGLRPASPAALAVLVSRTLARAAPDDFRNVAALPGFNRLICRLVEEFSSAGCDPSRLAVLLARPGLNAPLGAAFLQVYSAVMEELSLRGLSLRGQLLAAAAAKIRKEGLPGIRRVYVDGFFSFNSLELEVLRAIDACAELNVALPSWEGAAALRAAFAGRLSEERLEGSRREPRRHLVSAPTASQEAEEISRRILEEASGGRPFREIGVVVRSASSALGALRAAFSRFGIPARFYFAEPLAAHPAIRYLSAIVEAKLAGWDHEILLAALRMTPSGLGGTPEGDRLDFQLRRMLPGRGLAALEPLLNRFSPALWEGLRRMDGWPALDSAAGWAARAASLRGLVSFGRIPDSPEQAFRWRAHVAALDAFETTAQEAALAGGGAEPTALAEFWKLLETALRATGIRVPDRRRDVVHVIDVYEARQWELPVVFVCGLIEKEFPRYHSQDPVFDDQARAWLAAAGVELRSSAGMQREEEFLFSMATSRATGRLILSYPRFNSKGDENLLSFFLEPFQTSGGISAEDSRPVRPAPAVAKPLPLRPAIRDEQLRVHLSGKHSTLAPTSVETFLHCPFQFFARKTLGLQEPPEAPGDRLTALVQGEILHQTLARFAQEGGDLPSIFEELFEQTCERERVPAGYRREAVRFEMARNLSNFLRDRTLPPGPGWTTRVEEEFEFSLNERLRIRGRIDRLEIHEASKRALVIDYKYSSQDRIRQNIRENEKGQLVQGGLYMLAAERGFGLHPAGMLYCGLRREVSWQGWHVPIESLRQTGESATDEVLRERIDDAVSRTLEAAEAIAAGRIAPQPADKAKCRYCEFLDVCRYEAAAVPPVLAAPGDSL